jgi:TolB protein
MNADGSGQTRLTNLPDGADKPAWSPNGESIAFSTDRGDRPDQIYIIKTDGTSLHRVTTVPGTCCPAWSPDGKKIAFARGRIFTIDVDGGRELMLTHIGSDDHPAWSPDGKAIAFTRMPTNPWSQGFFHFQIYVMNADGSGVMQLTNNGAENRSPTWSRTP